METVTENATKMNQYDMMYKHKSRTRFHNFKDRMATEKPRNMLEIWMHACGSHPACKTSPFIKQDNSRNRSNVTTKDFDKNLDFPKKKPRKPQTHIVHHSTSVPKYNHII